MEARDLQHALEPELDQRGVGGLEKVVEVVEVGQRRSDSTSSVVSIVGRVDGDQSRASRSTSASYTDARIVAVEQSASRTWPASERPISRKGQKRSPTTACSIQARVAAIGSAASAAAVR